jgi:hypothetical protein
VTDDKHSELCPIQSYEHQIYLFFECNFSVRIGNHLHIDKIQNDNLQTGVSSQEKFWSAFLRGSINHVMLEYLVN